MKSRTILLLAFMQSMLISAQVTLPKVLTSHMVVQRDLPVHVWGNATPGERLRFLSRRFANQADALGHWSVYLKPGAAGGPFQLTVSASGPKLRPRAADHARRRDGGRCVGGIRPVQYGISTESASNCSSGPTHRSNPQIRLLMIRKRSSDYAMPDADTDGWALSNPETAKEFSAVAWYFARDIAAREHVAVGVIDATWGGTVAKHGCVSRLSAKMPRWLQFSFLAARWRTAQQMVIAEQKDQQRQIEEAESRR